jgi:hypothetical protein
MVVTRGWEERGMGIGVRYVKFQFEMSLGDGCGDGCTL